MRLFFLILGGIFVCWSILQWAVLMLTFKARVKHWNRLIRILLMIVILPTGFLLDILNRPGKTRHLFRWTFERLGVHIATGVFLLLGFLLLLLGTVLR